MAKARRVQAEEWWYTPLGDRGLPPEERSRFRLRPMTVTEKAYATDNMVARDGGEVRLRNYQTTLAIARACIVEADNFPAGAPEPWPGRGGDAAKDRYLARMGQELVSEIGHHAFDMSSLETPPDTGAPSLGNS